MLESAWLFLGAIAFCWTVITVVGAVLVSTESADRSAGDALATVGGVLGFVLWGVWTFGALNVEVVTESGSEVTVTHPSLALVGIALALVPGYIALTGPIELIRRARETEAKNL